MRAASRSASGGRSPSRSSSRPACRRGQGCAEFVGDVGGQAAAYLFGADDLVGHGVERAGDSPSSPGAFGAARAVVGRRRSGGRRRPGRQGPGQPAHDVAGDEQRGGQRDGRGADHPATRRRCGRRWPPWRRPAVRCRPVPGHHDRCLTSARGGVAVHTASRPCRARPDPSPSRPHHRVVGVEDDQPGSGGVGDRGRRPQIRAAQPPPARRRRAAAAAARAAVCWRSAALRAGQALVGADQGGDRQDHHR